MGLIFFLLVNVLIFYAVYSTLRNFRKWAEFLQQLSLHPIIFIYKFIFFSSTLIAGWGILSNGHLSWKVKIFGGTIQSWQLAGLIAFICLFIGFLHTVYENDIKNR